MENATNKKPVKSFNVNTGSALILSEQQDLLSKYDSVSINAGDVIISRNAYETMTGMGVSINCGAMKILEIEGKIAELSCDTVVTASMSYGGCYLVCDGNLVVKDAKGLDGITGLFARRLFHAESVDLSAVKGITAPETFTYPDDAILKLSDLTLGEDSQIVLEGGSLYWVFGTVKALDGGALERLRQKKTAFRCRRLIIYTELFEEYRDMFQAENIMFIPDNHEVVDSVTLNAATSAIYGDKLFVVGDMNVPYDQTEHLGGFASLIVHGSVTLPVSAAAAFKAVGKAGEYDLYEGALVSVNGFQTIGRAQLQTAIANGIRYTLRVNGALYFQEDVTELDMEAVAAVQCNGLISVPDRARAVLDSRMRDINGSIVDIDALIRKMYGDDFSYGDDPINFIKKMISQIQGDGADGGRINSGSFRM